MKRCDFCNREEQAENYLIKIQRANYFVYQVCKKCMDDVDVGKEINQIADEVMKTEAKRVALIEQIKLNNIGQNNEQTRISPQIP